MGDRLDVGLLQGDQFVRKQSQRPPMTTVRWIATGQRDEVGFVLAIEFTFVLTVGIAAMNRRNPVFTVAFPRSMGGY